MIEQKRGCGYRNLMAYTPFALEDNNDEKA